MPNLFKGHPEFTPELISAARRLAAKHGHWMLKPAGRMSAMEWGLGAYRLTDADGKVIAGRGHTMTPRDVAKFYGCEL